MKNWEISCFKHKLSYLESTDDEVFSREKKASKEEIREEKKDYLFSLFRELWLLLVALFLAWQSQQMQFFLTSQQWFKTPVVVANSRGVAY